MGVLALQGDFEAHVACFGAPWRNRAGGARARRSGRPGRACDPRRRVHHDDAWRGARGSCRAVARAGCAQAVGPILGSCAGLIMLDREHLGIMDMLAERNAFGRQLRSFEADLEMDGHRGRAAAGRVHPRAVDRRARPRRGDPRRGRRPCGRRSSRPRHAVAFHTELGRDDRLHRLFSGRRRVQRRTRRASLLLERRVEPAM